MTTKWMSIVVLALTVEGCAFRQPPVVAMPPPPPPPPPAPAPQLSVFNDGEYWVLLNELRYEMGNTGLTIAVPRGFVTDLTSVPSAVRSAVSVMGRHGRAAIVHDYLYWQQECTREQADQIMVIAMVESGVSANDIFGIHLALRLFGGPAWANNGTERQQGLPRRVPEPGALPPLAEWRSFRRDLYVHGARPDPVAATPPAYCAAAMRTNVRQ